MILINKLSCFFQSMYEVVIAVFDTKFLEHNFKTTNTFDGYTKIYFKSLLHVVLF